MYLRIDTDKYDYAIHSYAIHKKFGTIRIIPKHADGYMNQIEWALYDHFPTEEEYFRETVSFYVPISEERNG